MYTLLVSLSIVISVLLIIMVLLQSSKGGGLAGAFGGANQFGTMFGTRRTADFLSKATWWLGGALAVLVILVNLFFLPGQAGQSAKESIIQNSRRAVPTQPSLPAEQKK